MTPPKEPPQWQQWRDMRAEMDRKYVAATPLATRKDLKNDDRD